MDYEITTSLQNPRPAQAPPGKEAPEPVPSTDDVATADTSAVRAPRAFDSPEQELKQLAITNVHFEEGAAAVIETPVRQPQGPKFWDGRKKVREYPSIGRISTKDIDEEWNKERDMIEKRQREYVEVMKREPISAKTGYLQDSGEKSADDGDFDEEKPEFREDHLLNLINTNELERDRTREGLVQKAEIQRIMPNDDLMVRDTLRKNQQRKEREAAQKEKLRQEMNRKRKANNLPEIPEPLTASQKLAKRQKAYQDARAAQLLKSQAQFEKALKIVDREKRIAEIIKNTPEEELATPAPILPKSSSKVPPKSNSLRKPPAEKPPKIYPPKKPLPKTGSPTQGSPTPSPTFRVYPEYIRDEQLAKYREWDKEYQNAAMPDKLANEIQRNETISAWWFDYLGIIDQETLPPSQAEIEKNIRSSLESKAKASGSGLQDFADSQGFESFEALLADKIASAEADNPRNTFSFPGYLENKIPKPGKNEPYSVKYNSDLRFHVYHALQEGLKAQAKKEGKTREDMLKKKGFKNFEQYVDDCMNFMELYEEYPPKNADNYNIRKGEEEAKVKQNMETSQRLQDFITQVENLEILGPEETTDDKGKNRIAVV